MNGIVMNKPKYKIGDRFTVMDIVQCEIVKVFGGKETAYIFQVSNNPKLKSVITEKELNNVLKTAKQS